jgi:3-deoxy-D-manno-octulosonic-acid transferase
MITLYRIFTHIAYALAYPYGYLKARGGVVIWRDRLAVDNDAGTVDLWIHAASVGEVRVVSHLVEFLIRTAPEVRILVSVITATGYQAACDEFGARVDVRYFPFDAAVPMRRTLVRVRPQMIVIAETEIWPNFILEADRLAIPIILVNGRMSEKAGRRYKWIRRSVSRVLSCHQHFFFKTKEDAERYSAYGVSPDRATVAGDMKFDAPVVEKNSEAVAEIRRRAGVARDAFLLVAGSTRPGEEEQLLRAYPEMVSRCPRLRLAIAPRHVERADEIKSLIVQCGLKCSMYDGGDDQASADAIVLVDRMGILKDLYAAADLAFVGGTLVEIGGHNILEPVWMGTPVVYGPSLNNVCEGAKYIEANRYGQRVQSADELSGVIAAMGEGRLSFRAKTSDDYMHSPTAVVGAYIVKILRHA